MIVFEPQEGLSMQVIRVSVKDDGREVGFYLLVPQAVDIYEVHTYMNIEAYGSAVEIGKEAMVEAFKALPNMITLVTKVPVNNLLAKRLAIKVGMKKCGNIPKSFNGIDQEIFYINREELECQSQ